MLNLIKINQKKHNDKDVFKYIEKEITKLFYENYYWSKRNCTFYWYGRHRNEWSSPNYENYGFLKSTRK